MRSESPAEYWNLLKMLKEDSSQKDAAAEINTDEWAKYFQKLNQSHEKASCTYMDAMHEIEENTTLPSELDKIISVSEIQKCIKNLKNRKAQGLDQISNEMIKYSQHVTIPLLHKLFNLILRSGIYPKQWTVGYITPIFKSGNPLVQDNYRGITIMSCLGKLFNSVINTRLDNYLIGKNIIHDVQIGYKKGSRTTDHIFVLKTLADKITKLEKGKLFTCFVDFRKAFDTVSHNALFYTSAPEVQNIIDFTYH